MAPQRYERVSNADNDELSSTPRHSEDNPIPDSPPPSFRSRDSFPSSHRLLSSEDPAATEEERTLAEAFDDGTPSDDEDDGGDDRQRLMRSNPTMTPDSTSAADMTGQEVQQWPDMGRRTVTQLPPPTTGMPYRPFQSSNDGVFANLNAKPERGGEKEELPPTYEQAAADATPPYWDATTVLTPGMATDEVYYEGLAVGSLFSFTWNALISLSFQLVGFLLTYLLHTTHAAKHGSRAGLGITLVQWGFGMRASSAARRNGGQQPIQDGGAAGGASSGFEDVTPPDPNSHDFDPNAISTAAAIAAQQAAQQSSSSSASSSMSLGKGGSHDWIAYALMVVGWLVLIKALTDFYKARRHEKLVLASPERGLNVAVVGEGERPEAVA